MEEFDCDGSSPGRVSLLEALESKTCSETPPSDGKKMSKSLKNYPDPNLIIDQYGADATR